MKTLVFLLFSLMSVLVSAQTLDIHIKNIRNQKGQICIAVFANQDEFTAEKTLFYMKCNKNEVVNGELHLQLPFRAGKFGVSVLDDENKTGRMEYGFLGIPKKGFGFSNFYLKGLSKPVFDDFSFNLNTNEVKLLDVIMKYF